MSISQCAPFRNLGSGLASAFQSSEVTRYTQLTDLLRCQLTHQRMFAAQFLIKLGLGRPEMSISTKQMRIAMSEV